MPAQTLYIENQVFTRLAVIASREYSGNLSAAASALIAEAISARDRAEGAEPKDIQS